MYIGSKGYALGAEELFGKCSRNNPPNSFPSRSPTSPRLGLDAILVKIGKISMSRSRNIVKLLIIFFDEVLIVDNET